MSKKCVTHHFACDCREAMMREVCRCVLEDHEALARFKCGFGPYRKCECDLCKTARKMFPDLNKED